MSDKNKLSPSERTRELWKNKEFREKLTKKRQEIWKQPGYREKQRRIHKIAWNVPSTRLSQTEYDEFCRNVILQSNKTCGMCGEQGNYPWNLPAKSRDLEVHHLDGNHSNNDSKNVIAVHHGCHASIHLTLWFYKLGHKPTSKSNQYGVFSRYYLKKEAK